MAETQIVICYKYGTRQILRACLKSILKYTNNSYNVMVVFNRNNCEFDAFEELNIIPNKILHTVKIDNVKTKSGIHGLMLDSVIPDIDSKYVMTLDSDCFPVAKDWLSGLINMINEGAGCAGILYPFSPPPADMQDNMTEKRIRKHHCWNNTHVACNLIKTDLLRELIKEHNVKYCGGLDTGELVTRAINDRGLPIRGYKVTKCPKASPGNIDEEFNRYVSLIYGNRVYHHGGYTRESVCGDKPVQISEYFEWARKEVINTSSAEFLLNDENSHNFRWDREKEVSDFQIKLLFGLRDNPPKIPNKLIV